MEGLFRCNSASHTATKGALVFLSVGDRWFALSFGQVFHHLNDAAYEYDFGLRVTLNSVDPNELKSADMVAPGVARRKRTQAPVSTELTFLDFDGNSEIIKGLTGRVKREYQDLSKNATGSVSLKVGLDLEPGELAGICETLLTLYQAEDYQTSFPNYSEEGYNAAIPRWNNAFICLDQSDISPAGSTQIEPSMSIPSRPTPTRHAGTGVSFII
ncbi:DUF6119 family protein [Ensifer aridi]|uniref:DUF6119 family protein n=1 Tax=Ensifer aridi TaxID=1708715 RepID=UPI00358EAE25